MVLRTVYHLVVIYTQLVHLLTDCILIKVDQISSLRNVWPISDTTDTSDFKSIYFYPIYSSVRPPLLYTLLHPL